MRIKDSDRTAYVTLNSTLIQTRAYILDKLTNITQAIQYLADLPEMLGPNVSIKYHSMFACEKNPGNAKRTIQKQIEGPELINTETANELAKLGQIQYTTVTLVIHSETIPMLNTEFWMSADLRPDGRPVLSITAEYQGPLDELEIRLGLD